MYDPVIADLDRYLDAQDAAEALYEQACAELAEEGNTDPTEEEIDERMDLVEQQWIDNAREAEVDRHLSRLDDIRHGYV